MSRRKNASSVRPWVQAFRQKSSCSCTSHDSKVISHQSVCIDTQQNHLRFMSSPLLSPTATENESCTEKDAMQSAKDHFRRDLAQSSWAQPSSQGYLDTFLPRRLSYKNVLLGSARNSKKNTNSQQKITQWPSAREEEQGILHDDEVVREGLLVSKTLYDQCDIGEKLNRADSTQSENWKQRCCPEN